MKWGDSWGELWGGNIPDITTHKDDAIDRLIDYFDKDNWRKAICIIGDRAQAVEDVVTNIPWLYDIRVAYGYWQDVLGRIVDEPRNAQTDGDYRKLQRAKAQQIKQRRTAENLLLVMRRLVNDDSRFIRITDSYPKSYKLEVENLTTAEIVTFLPFVARSRPITYQGKFVIVVPNAFGHSDASGTLPPPPPPAGFGDASGTIVGAGGPLSYIVPF